MNPTRQYEFNSDLILVPQMVERILSEIREVPQAFCEEELFRVKVVLHELLTNAIIHGNRNVKGMQVTVERVLTARELVFHVRDRGRKFFGQGTAEENLLVESNRGILICQSMCDRISNSYVKGEGNTVSAWFVRKYVETP